MKIRGAVLREMGLPRPYDQSRPLEIAEVALDGPGPEEVLVEVKAAGLCHSDLSTVNGDRPRPMPMLLGHEAAGIVLETGDRVRDLRAGDRVVMVFAPHCGHCLACVEGRPGNCDDGQKANGAGEILGGGQRMNWQGGQRVYHHLGVSAFATHTVAHRNSLVKLEADVTFAEAALFGCAVLTGVGAVVNTARVPAGAKVAVVGLGGVGFNALLGARLAGASEVHAVDLLDDKLALARELGATSTWRADTPDLITAVKDATRGGVDYAFEMAGSTRALEVAYRLARRGGTVVTAGLPHPDDRWPLQAVNLVAEEKTVKGSYMGSCLPQRDIPRFLDLYQRGHLPVARLMSSRLKLDEINEGFERLAAGSVVRQIIEF